MLLWIVSNVSSGVNLLVSGEMFQKIWFQICSLEIAQQILHLSLGYKIRPLINHFNAAFGEALSLDNEQSIDEHMTKFKGKHGCKQYLLLKPIKWGFKWWCRCSSSGYLYETDLYLGKKQETEYNLSESVVLNLSQSLRDTYCTLYFDNFFSSPTLIGKLFDDGIYGIGTVRLNHEMMPKLPDDKSMKWGDIHYQYSKKVICVKWKDNSSVFYLDRILMVQMIVQVCKGVRKVWGIKLHFHAPSL